jgi:hypothetical protein
LTLLITEARNWIAASACLIGVFHASHAAAESPQIPAVSARAAQQPALAPVRLTLAAPQPAPPFRLFGLRLPAFIAFGVGGLSTGGAVATRIAASSSTQNADCGANCSDARVARSKTLSFTSTVLAGVAAAGIGTGIVLLLCSPSDSERVGLAPALKLRVGTQKAVAGMVWKF